MLDFGCPAYLQKVTGTVKSDAIKVAEICGEYDLFFLEEALHATLTTSEADRELTTQLYAELKIATGDESDDRAGLPTVHRATRHRRHPARHPADGYEPVRCRVAHAVRRGGAASAVHSSAGRGRRVFSCSPARALTTMLAGCQQRHHYRVRREFASVSRRAPSRWSGLPSIMNETMPSRRRRS